MRKHDKAAQNDQDVSRGNSTHMFLFGKRNM